MLFLTACFPKNFTADRCNIMQEASECLEVTHSHPNFTLGNQFKEIMKREADAGNINDRRNHNRRGSSSQNAEIEAYLSTHYEFKYNTVLGRPYSYQIERPKSGLSEQGDTGTCRLHCA